MSDLNEASRHYCDGHKAGIATEHARAEKAEAERDALSPVVKAVDALLEETEWNDDDSARTTEWEAWYYNLQETYRVLLKSKASKP